MTSRAHVEFDVAMMGVRIAMLREGNGVRQVLQWEPGVIKTITDAVATQPADSDWLRLPEDDARALYEALSDYFGHAGHDVRALRKDYEAERKRVDLLIDRAVPKAVRDA